ncbi:MAG: CHASE2 domain-containing protein [Leptolyngbyaceae cyanobacterium]
MNQDFADAVVLITSCNPEENSAFGTGFVIDMRQSFAYVLTCAHVFEDTRTNDQVLVNGHPGDLLVTGYEEGVDLAVIRVESLQDKKPVPLRSIGKQGGKFQVLGYYGYDTDDRIARREIKGSLGKSFGVSSNDKKTLIDAWDLIIQDRDHLAEGYSGSPVIDIESGCAIGIVSHRIKQGQEGHAISIQGLLKVWPSETSLLEDQLVGSGSVPPLSSGNKAAQIYRHFPKRAVTISVMMTLATIVLRFFGAFEFLELRAYDHVLSSRPAEPKSDRIVVIEADREDVEAQEINGETRNLTSYISDEALEETVTKLNEYGARIIGIDLYLFKPESAWPESTLKAFQLTPELYGVCEQPYNEQLGDSQPSIAPPSPNIIPPEKVGFSNLTFDRDQVLRRHLIEYRLTDEQADSACRSEFALSMVIALRYLELELSESFRSNGLYAFLSGPKIQIDNILIEGIDSYEYGGYADLISEAFELMLNYREPEGHDLRSPFPHFSMEALRQGDFEPGAFKDKIVLIGLTARSYATDQFLTPYQQDTVPGVTLHAHMIDQIISAVLEDRPLIWVWSDWTERGWIGFWGMAGGLLAYYCGRWRWRIGLLGAGLGSIYLVCILTMLLAAGWIPMVPAFVAFALSNGVVIYTQSSLRESVS